MNEAKSSSDPDLFRIYLIIQTNKGFGILRLFFCICRSFFDSVSSSLELKDLTLVSSIAQTQRDFTISPISIPT